ncbi:MAG: DUF481 domain-containing protein [Verrucomicrobia bacterium]|nr:MAG: DUF481 domain-containing protein [Verrucomicrobiota bacterium]
MWKLHCAPMVISASLLFAGAAHAQLITAPEATTNQAPPVLPPAVVPPKADQPKTAPGMDWKAIAPSQLMLRDDVTVEAPNSGATNQSAAWGLTLAAGAVMNSGNSDTTLYNISAEFERKGQRHELRLAGNANYGTDQGATTVDNAKGVASYHYRFSARWYAVADGSAFRDRIAAVNYRLIGSPGLGFYFIRNKRVALGVESGPAYLQENKGEVEDNRILLRCAERGEWLPLATSRVWEAIEFLPPVDHTQEYLLSSEAGAEAALTTLLNVRIVVKNIYDNNPAPGRKNSDVSITGALAVKL